MSTVTEHYDRALRNEPDRVALVRAVGAGQYRRIPILSATEQVQSAGWTGCYADVGGVSILFSETIGFGAYRETLRLGSASPIKPLAKS